MYGATQSKLHARNDDDVKLQFSMIIATSHRYLSSVNNFTICVTCVVICVRFVCQNCGRGGKARLPVLSLCRTHKAKGNGNF